MEEADRNLTFENILATSKAKKELCYTLISVIGCSLDSPIKGLTERFQRGKCAWEIKETPAAKTPEEGREGDH